MSSGTARAAAGSAFSSTATFACRSPAPAGPLRPARRRPVRPVLHAHRVGLTREHIALAELDADGESEVIVDLFTGGANCCVLVPAYGYDSASRTSTGAPGSTRAAGTSLATTGARRRDRARRATTSASAACSPAAPAARGRSASGTTASPLRGRHRVLPATDPLARPARCGACTRACVTATRRPSSSRARSRRTPPTCACSTAAARASAWSGPPSAAASSTAARPSTSRPLGAAYLRALKRFLRRAGYLG